MKDNFHEPQPFVVVKDRSYSVYGEDRYVIMDVQRKEILDDGQGSGYTSYKKAYRCAIHKLKNQMAFVTCDTTDNQ